MQISSSQLSRAVREAIPQIATTLRPDMLAALEKAYAAEPAGRGRLVLAQLLENARIAREDKVPICQDTGTVWVYLEVGPDVCLAGDIFCEVDAAVAQAYKQGHLRMSVVRDAYCDRSNTCDNTPAFCDLGFREAPGATLSVMLKGGGSDNASRVVMLPPGAGKQGICDVVLSCVREKAANACPPLLVGVGIGSTFDHVGGLAKKALLRDVDTASQQPEIAVLEAELLEKINATGIGPGALGGCCCAVGVHIETAACHIAALPVAVNMGCSALRSVTMDLGADDA